MHRRPHSRSVAGRAVVAGVLLAAAGIAACSSPDVETVIEADPAAAVTYAAAGHPEGLERFHTWSGRLCQGAQPHGDVAFRNLAALGVRTVLSVDGARPDLEAAARHGLRYVHVPIGYDGVPRDKALQIVKAVAATDGLVYVHCHHGKHRGPAGAAVARIALDGVSAEDAVEGLRVSKTSPKYTGLYRDIAGFATPAEAELAAVSDDLPAFVPPDGMVDSMVHVSHRWEYLKRSRELGWAAIPDEPDVSPPHEARMLWEQLRETARLEESRGYGERFMELLREGEEAGHALETALRSGDAAARETAFEQVGASCNACHTDYRNN